MENIAFEQKNLLENLQTLMSIEVAGAFDNFPENKKQAVLQLSPQQQATWCKLHHEIARLKIRKADLEDALVSGNVKAEDLATANATLEGMNKTCITLQAQEENLLYPSKSGCADQPNPFYDRNARPGVLSIRPTYKGDQAQLIVRKQKVK